MDSECNRTYHPVSLIRCVFHGIQAARVADVDVLDGSTLTQPGFAEQALHLSGIPNCLFVVEQVITEN